MKLENLEKLRKEKGFFTQEEFAIAIGTTRPTYSKYVNGKLDIPLDILTKIAKDYNVSTDYILGLSNCKSVENDYISKHLGLSDDAINGLREIAQTDSEQRLFELKGFKEKGRKYRKASIYNISVINFMLSHVETLKLLIDSFINFSVPFLFSVPVMTDSKGKWKKIDTKKNRFALASFDNQLDDNIYMPVDYMPVLISTHARKCLSDSLDDLSGQFQRYALESGATDASTLLKYAYAKNTKL